MEKRATHEDVLLDLHTVHRDALLPHVENLEVVVDSRVLDFVLLALGLGVARHLDAEVVAALLPVHLAVRHTEQVLRPDLQKNNFIRLFETSLRKLIKK